MVAVKTGICKRALSFILCFVLLIMIILSPLCTAKAYAISGVVTVVGVGSLLVIGSILVGLGIEIVDPGAFERLCQQVHQKLNDFAVVRDEIFLKIQNGIQYVEKLLVENIIRCLVEMSAFSQVPETKTVELYGLKLKVFSGDETSHLRTPVSYFGTAFKYDPVANLNKTLVHDYSDVFSVSISSYDAVFPHKGSIRFNVNNNLYYGSNGGSVNGDVGYPIILSGYLALPVSYIDLNDYSKRLTAFCIPRGATYYDTSKADITPDYKVGEKLPSIANDGTVAMPFDTPWAKNPAIPVAGAPSIPLTVPGDLSGLKDKTQEGIMSGSVSDTSTGDAALEAEIDKTLEQMKTPPSLIEKFPFSIPFDVFRALQTLAAPPVAPAFVLPLKAPAYGIDYEIKMDWQKFEIPLAIVRWGTFLIFLLSLAIGTKKLIWG